MNESSHNEIRLQSQNKSHFDNLMCVELFQITDFLFDIDCGREFKQRHVEFACSGSLQFHPLLKVHLFPTVNSPFF